ncbi:MAG: glycosyltransferase [Anaerohalosphaeraceae bacterium]|nr:glycosyltransferase [Anaerohalosphaeraceae bacterium]
MPKGLAKKVAFISSYPPRKCGIGTFVNDLITSVKAYAPDKFKPLVVAMSNDSYDYPRQVEFEIRPNVKNDYISAAEYLNFSNVDVVSVQHEFGLFGGTAGAYLGLFLQNIKAPVVTTLHTILNEPTPDYYKSMMDLCQYSDKLIVMNARGIDMLKDIYKVPAEKIELIAHGLPDLPFVDSSYYKHKFDFDGRKTLMTFGLIGRSKGIEVMIEAMSDIVKADPAALYIILGVTHPELVKFEGESYRFSLQRRVKELGLEDNIVFHNRFVTDEDLHDFLCATDIYVTPYLAKEQLTSGTLAFAVGAGKAVVSTPYWAADELLADGRGKLVKFGDAKDLADSIIEISKDQTLFQSMRRRAYDYGRTRTWPSLGRVYWEQFANVKTPTAPAAPLSGRAKSQAILELPEPPLDHLIRITDDTGLIQHAKYMLPDRVHGYCTDDNARALVAMTKYYKQYSEPDSLKLLETYLAFTLHSQKPDGTVHNFMNYARHWRTPEPAHDATGRSIWALGSVIASPPMPMYLSIIKEYFDKSAQHIPNLSPRGMSYSILGLTDYLHQFPGASEIKKILTAAADTLVALYEKNATADWCWFENILAYDNAIMPAALFVAAMTLGEKKYADIAEKTCLFLLENIYNGSYFSFIGSNGWYPNGKTRAGYDQQPIEVASTIIMLRYAYELTVKSEYLKLQRKAFDWFMGDNDLNTPVYDFQTKGCCDGLEQGGVNVNQGAESIVSFLLSLLYVVESFTGTKSNDKAASVITTANHLASLQPESLTLADKNISAKSV